MAQRTSVDRRGREQRSPYIWFKINLLYLLINPSRISKPSLADLFGSRIPPNSFIIDNDKRKIYLSKSNRT